MQILMRNYQKKQKIYQRKNKSMKSSKDAGKSTSAGDIEGRTPPIPKI